MVVRVAPAQWAPIPGASVGRGLWVGGSYTSFSHYTRCCSLCAAVVRTASTLERLSFRSATVWYDVCSLPTLAWLICALG